MAAKLIPVSPVRHIAADEFKEIRLAEKRVDVFLRDGSWVHIGESQGKSALEIRDELVAQVNTALGETCK